MNPNYPLQLSARNIIVHHKGTETPALDGVSIAADAGRIHAIVGESGAGKSSLLNSLAGFAHLSAGHITFDGETLARDRVNCVKPAQRSFAYVFQDPALFPHMNLVENVCFGRKGLTRFQRQELAEDWLLQFGLLGRGKAYPHEISGGEAQRVALARALASEPRAILLDEPFSSLNADLREEIEAIVFGHIRAANLPCFWVTHAPDQAMQHADVISVFANGKCLQTGMPIELLQTPADIRVLKAITDVSVLSAADWPSGFMGLTPEYTDGIVAIRIANFSVSEGRDNAPVETFTVQNKILLGEKLRVGLVSNGIALEGYFPIYQWDWIEVGKDIRVQIPPFSIFNFPTN